MNWMTTTLFAALGAAGTLLLAPAVAPTPASTVSQGDPSAEMKEAMKKVARYTKPGENHKLLERFVGKWDTESRFFMGDQATPPEKGTFEFSWLMPGRWLSGRGTGKFMGQSIEQFHVLGYDNFKMSFVTTGVTNVDTAMVRLEGDMTHDGKALILYGTLDEYTTGEHDKMVKYVYRFVDADKIVLEVHDLPIGETNTKVVEFTFTRAK